MIRRPKRLLLILIGLAAFLVISGVLARWLSLENAERNDIVSLLQAQARGDAGSMIAQLYHCDGRCRSIVRRDARTLRHRGQIVILADQSATAYALTSRTADTRIAWRAGGSANEVQCVTVSRTGNAITGLTLRLLAIGPPLPRSGSGDITIDCSLRYDG